MTAPAAYCPAYSIWWQKHKIHKSNIEWEIRKHLLANANINNLGKLFKQIRLYANIGRQSAFY